MILQRGKLHIHDHEAIYSAQDNEIFPSDFFTEVSKIEEIVGNTIGCISKPPQFKSVNYKLFNHELLSLGSFPMTTEDAPEDRPVLLLSTEDIQDIFYGDDNNSTINIRQYYFSNQRTVVIREFSLNDKYIPFKDLQYKIDSVIEQEKVGPTLVVSVFTFHSSKYNDEPLYFLGTELAEIIYAYLNNFKHSIYNVGFRVRRALIMEDYGYGVNSQDLYFLIKYITIDVCVMKAALFVKDIQIYKEVLWWVMDLIGEDILQRLIDFDYTVDSSDVLFNIFMDFVQDKAAEFIEGDGASED